MVGFNRTGDVGHANCSTTLPSCTACGSMSLEGKGQHAHGFAVLALWHVHINHQTVSHELRALFHVLRFMLCLAGFSFVGFNAYTCCGIPFYSPGNPFQLLSHVPVLL